MPRATEALAGDAPIPREDELLEAARAAAGRAYAPYSQFRVGAAVLTRSGAVHLGANMENAVYGLGLCAEVAAMTAATTAGDLAEVVAIAIVGFPERAPEAGRPVPPCGRCRQIIQEAASLGGRDIAVVFADGSLENRVRTRISELLPYRFDGSLL